MNFSLELLHKLLVGECYTPSKSSPHTANGKAYSASLMDFYFVEELRVDCQSRVLERLNRKLPVGSV